MQGSVYRLSKSCKPAAMSACGQHECPYGTLPARAWRVPLAVEAGVARRGCSAVPGPGKAAAGLERRVLRQGLVATARRGRKAVTAILSATHNLGLDRKRQRKKPLKQDPRPADRSPCQEHKVVKAPHESHDLDTA